MITLNASQKAKSPQDIFPPDVLEFFNSKRGAFGALNLLDSHLPTHARVRELVKNVMTVDYAIGRAFNLPDYTRYVSGFAEASTHVGSLPGLNSLAPYAYQRHAEQLAGANAQSLANMMGEAISNSMEAFNLFSPKQCNLSCKGCYSSAVPVEKRPFEESMVQSYFDRATQIILEAKALGAQVVYTSGDGEVTIFPKFFDLLEFIEAQNMQWVFFTAGLSFSSEENARITWETSRLYLSTAVRERIEADIRRYASESEPKPIAKSFLAELARHRDSIQVYHSIWSTNPRLNSSWRRPGAGDYDYVTVESRGRDLYLPSSIPEMMNSVFPEPYRHRFGLEMPVSHLSYEEIGTVATFVFDNGLRSYFEPAIMTGRNKGGSLEAAPDEELFALSPVLVRSLCSFRNIHQPTVKFLSSEQQHSFHISPGMGVDLQDLASAGVLGSTNIPALSGGFFAAVHSPLMVHANYAYITGCKCNDFAKALTNDRARLVGEWQRNAQLIEVQQLTPEAIYGRLLRRELEVEVGG